MIPVEATLLEFPGWLNTLNASTLKRTNALSVIGIVLNSEASMPHCSVLGRYCCRHGCRLSLKVVRSTVPLFIGSQTVFVPYQAYSGSVVFGLAGHGISGSAAGL